MNHKEDAPRGLKRFRVSKLTIIVGVIALVALAFPSLVILGFYCFIVPGLILMLAPTVFVYLAAATAIRPFLPFGTGRLGTAAALIATGVLGCLLAWPFHLMGVRHYRAAIKEDVGGGIPLQLSGHIRLERGDVRSWKRDGEKTCDALCAALLLTPGVESVTLVKGKNLESATHWRLVPRGSVPDTGLAPTNPEEIFSHYPVEAHQPRTRGRGELASSDAENKNALAAEWNLRLATSATLLSSDRAPDPDMTITITDQRDPSMPKIQRVEIRDKAGVPLLRRSLVKHAVAGLPFFISFEAHTYSGHFLFGQKMLSTGGRSQDFDAVTELLRNVDGLRHSPSREAPRQARERLVAALDTPDGNPPDLALAGPWSRSLGYHFASDGDAILFQRIVADLRIGDVGEPMRNLYAKSAPIEYRPILVQRIIAATTGARDRSFFASLLSKMPEGTFANMTEQEWQIIKDPKLRSDAAPFVERLADTGKPGTRHLLEILRQAATIPVWNDRSPTLRAVRRGLARLGPDAAEALPVVRGLFEQKRSPITQSARDALYWRIAMVRMGLPIDDLPFPPNWNEETIRKEREAVARGAAGFDPNAESGYGD